jgi:glycosyltransferase involved in cell wall biosynthesis
MDAPKVSIITINYNCNSHLQQHLDSVNKIDYANWEHVFVDCGSTDGSIDTITNNKHHRLSFYQIDFCTVSEARNFAISKSTGSICAILDSDDFICEKRISSQIKLLESGNDIIAVGGNFIGMMNRANIIARLFLKKKVDFSMPSNIVDISSLINSAFLPFPHSTFTFRKSDFNKIGGYKIEKSEDYELLLSFNDFGKILTESSISSIINFGRFNSHSSRYKPQNRTPLHYAFFSLLKNYNTRLNYKFSDDQLFTILDKLSYIELSTIQTKWLIRNFLNTSRLLKDNNLSFILKLVIRNLNTPFKLITFINAPISPEIFLKKHI